MVKDRFNEYFTKLYKYLVETYPDLQKTTKYTLKPAKFPTMYMRQIGGIIKADTLSNTSELRMIGIEVQFFSTKQNDVRKLADAAIGFMVETLFFKCTYASPEENMDDTNIFRFICRFEKLDT